MAEVFQYANWSAPFGLVSSVRIDFDGFSSFLLDFPFLCRVLRAWTFTMLMPYSTTLIVDSRYTFLYKSIQAPHGIAVALLVCVCAMQIAPSKSGSSVSNWLSQSHPVYVRVLAVYRRQILPAHSFCMMPKKLTIWLQSVERCEAGAEVMRPSTPPMPT